MAVELIKEEWCPALAAYRREFVMDSADDVSKLPACCPGSVAIVADKDGAVYMVNASGEWREQ